MKKTIIVGIAVVVVGSTLVYYFGFGPGKRQTPEPNQKTNAVTFYCDGNKSIAALFYPDNDTHVDLKLSDGRILSLPHAISASGARYANTDESIVFWNKGDTAFITENGTTTYANCALPGDIAGGQWDTFNDSARGIIFRYPENLTTKYIHTVDWPPKAQVLNEVFSCTQAGSETDRAGKTEQREINGNAYCVTRVSQGAAGSVYTMYAYAFPKDGKTVILTFSLRAVNCGNYNEPSMQECQNERQGFTMDDVMSRIAETVSLQSLP